MLKVHPKVTASAVGAALAGYVLSLVNDHLHVNLPADVKVLVPSVVAAGVAMLCGWLKSAGVVDVELDPEPLKAGVEDAPVVSASTDEPVEVPSFADATDEPVETAA